MGDRSAIAIALLTLADGLLARGMAAEAAVRYEEALTLFRALGHQRGTAATLIDLAAVALDAGEIARPLAILGESLDLLGPTGDRYLLVNAIEMTARAVLAGGEPVAAARLLGAAAAQREAVGAPRSPSKDAAYQRLLDLARATLGTSAFTKAWEAGAVLSLDRVLTEAATAMTAAALSRMGISRVLTFNVGCRRQ